ncbi:hypothetical protein BJY01DRAFT_213208 [Aspergillus pseudoustus]|uniref:Uncharacterized protein n=1 Tax=Aspergillus pseudoustus TaxID=1810923 RepID=A0ABR4K2Q2_9EURO
MSWYTLIAQFLGWYQKDLQTNSTGAATRRENGRASSNAETQICRQDDGTQRDGMRRQLSDPSGSLVSKPPLTPPLTPDEEAQSSLAITRRPDGIMDCLRALFSYRSMRHFLPPLNDRPPLGDEGEIIVSTTIETDAAMPSDDDLAATYYGYRIASFWIPPRRYNREKATVDVHCRATVCLDHYDFVGYQHIPSSEEEPITVLFVHEQWRVWVTVPYTYAKPKLRLQHDRSSPTVPV